MSCGRRRGQCRCDDRWRGSLGAHELPGPLVDCLSRADPMTTSVGDGAALAATGSRPSHASSPVAIPLAYNDNTA